MQAINVLANNMLKYAAIVELNHSHVAEGRVRLLDRHVERDTMAIGQLLSCCDQLVFVLLFVSRLFPTTWPCVQNRAVSTSVVGNASRC